MTALLCNNVYDDIYIQIIVLLQCISITDCLYLDYFLKSHMKEPV